LGSFSSACAQSVKLIGENFATSEVTFSVNLSPATPTWVFVEYTTPPHDPANMSRATFTSVSAGTLAANDQGFLLENSATITAKIKNAPTQFSWCAYAISAPPRAKMAPNGSYTLHGTPPFTIVTYNGTFTVDSHDFGPGTCITSITDFTYNPNGFLFDPPMTVTAMAETSECAGAVTFTATATGGTTTAMSYTWNIKGMESTIITNPYITALNTGEASYTVFATNIHGCTSTVSTPNTINIYATPVVLIANNATICSGLAATLTADVYNATTPANYEWIIDGAHTTTTNTNTCTTPVLTATSPTTHTYTVRITNTGTGNCTSALSVGTITVNPLPDLVFDNAPTAPVCPHTEILFTVSGADPGGSYCITYECPECLRNPFLTGKEVPSAAHCLWESDCVFGTENTYPVRMPDAGTMTVWVQAKNEYGCTSTASTVVEVIAVPTVYTVNSPTICYGTTAALSATVANTNASTTYTWDIEGYPATWTTTNTYTTPALTTTASYTVQIPNETGCTSTVSAAGRITVYNDFDPGSITASAQTICNGGDVDMIADLAPASGGNTAITYKWQHNGEDIGSTNAPAYTPSAYKSVAGTHTFTRWAIDGSCRSDFEQSAGSYVLTVYPRPLTPVNASSGTVCSGEIATFSAAPSESEGVTIDWYNAASAGTMVLANSPSFTPASPLTATTTATTNYYAEARIIETGCPSTARLTVPTTVQVPVVTAANASICYGTKGTLTATVTTTTLPATYTWVYNGATTTTETNSYTIPEDLYANVTYTVQVTSALGCTSTVSAMRTITVYNDFNPGTITTGASTICSNATIANITNAVAPSGGNGSFAYQWQRDGVVVSGTAQAYTFSANDRTTLGAHTFTRWVRDGLCQSGVYMQSAGSYVLTVLEIPATPVNASSGTICSGGTATFSASLTDSDGVTIDWYAAATGGSPLLQDSWSYTPDSPLTANKSFYAAARIIEIGCLSNTRLTVTTAVQVPTVTTSNVSVCPGPYTFTATAANTTLPATYTWVIDGATTTTTTNTYMVPDLYSTVTYTVQVTSALGCTSTVSAVRTITVYPELNPGSITSGAATICYNAAAAAISNAAAASNGTTIAYKWQHNGTDDIATNATAYTPAATYRQSPGTHTFTRWARNSCMAAGSYIQSAGSYVLIVRALPLTPVNANSGTVCSGTIATFSAETSDEDTETIDWYTASSGGNLLSSNSWSYTPASPLTATTSYYAVAKLIAAPNCVSTARLAVTKTVNIPAITAVSSATICHGAATTLTATATNAIAPATYTWEINGASTTTTTNTYPIAALMETATYTVQVTSAAGCTSAVSNTGTITVYPAFTPGTITTTEKTICNGDLVTAIANIPASGGNTAITYKWQHNGEDISGATAADYTPSGSYAAVGTHTFTRWAHDSQCQTGFIQSANSYVLTVNPAPDIPFNASNATICEGTPATFSALPNENVGEDQTIDWYDAQYGGNLLQEDSLSYTPALPLTVGTWSYYAAARIRATGCRSTIRLPVTTTVITCP
jgi:hypothetical protein